MSPIRVDGDSMNPTLENGDIMILNEIGYKTGGLKRFDIVVIDTEDDVIIKRVIGLPNETITYQDNHLLINGELIETDFDFADTEDIFESENDNVYENLT